MGSQWTEGECCWEVKMSQGIEIGKLQAKLALAVKVLEYYAQGAPVIGYDYGDKAREALAAIKERQDR